MNKTSRKSDTGTRKAAGYVRVSTPNQAKDGESLQTQKDSILRFCKNNNMTLIGIYADEGISGASTENRPQFMKLLEDAKNKKFDCLLVHSLSRFGRNTKETISNHELLESCGIELISMDCQMDTTTLTGKMFRSFLASVAEWERGTIKERMLENRTAKWKRGATFIGKVPYGYTWNREKKLIEINPDEEKIYKYIVSLYVNEGLSDLKIALRLKWEGIKFRNRKYPATQTISYMLKNPAYYGHYVLNKHEYTGDRRTGKLKPASDHVVL